LRLIDHSRSFRAQKTLRNPEQLTRFSKLLLEGLQRLNYADLRKQMSRYLIDAQVKTLIERRDAILELARKLVAEKGEAAVIYP
jgi:ribonucleotide reductase alpha subunit